MDRKHTHTRYHSIGSIAHKYSVLLFAGRHMGKMRLHFLAIDESEDGQTRGICVQTGEKAMATSKPKQLFSASLAKDAVYKTGLRSFMEYRDLGIEKATHGQFRAHVIRIKKDAGAHDLHTTGLHQHLCDFQMFYVLKGWIKFVYEGEGEHTFHAGDCVLQPAGIVHNELDCSDDLEVLEIYSPAIHQTVAVDKMPAAAD